MLSIENPMSLEQAMKKSDWREEAFWICANTAAVCAFLSASVFVHPSFFVGTAVMGRYMAADMYDYLTTYEI